MRRILASFGLVLAMGGAVGVWRQLETHAPQIFWDHWDVVKPGILYRSGQLTEVELQAAVKRFGIRTIVNFQLPPHGVTKEKHLARSLGVDFHNLPMPGDGFGLESQFREVLRLVDDPARQPVLVHCARGTCRTGAAVALYRFEHDGWTIEDVQAEMDRQVYRQGWLAGYVFDMLPPDRRANWTLARTTMGVTEPARAVATQPEESHAR